MIITGEAEEIIVGRPGEPLLEAAALAISAAKRRGTSVTLLVGDTAVAVAGTETPDEVVAAIGAGAAPVEPDAAMAEAIARAQVRLCNHLAGMKPALDAGERTSVVWLATLARLAEDERVILPSDVIRHALEARGYAAASGPERSMFGLPADTGAIARWLIGHTMARLARGERPHPLLGMLAERYDAARAGHAVH